MVEPACVSGSDNRAQGEFGLIVPQSATDLSQIAGLPEGAREVEKINIPSYHPLAVFRRPSLRCSRDLRRLA